jgi:hypothetical protein
MSTARVRSIVAALGLLAVAGCGGEAAVPLPTDAPVVTTAATPRTTVTSTTSLPPTTAAPSTAAPSTAAPATAVLPPATAAPATAAPATAAPTPVAPPVLPTAPTWAPYSPLAPQAGASPLTGLAFDEATSRQPVVVVKIDNARGARGQWGLDSADVVFEENVESLTRFVAVFHSRRPGEVGPVRSARTGDLALLEAFNRPVLAWSGGNPGVTAWVRSAAASGVVVDLSALREGGCYRREKSRKVPHNLLLSLQCATDRGIAAGAGAPLAPWSFLPEGQAPAGVPTESLDVAMDGVQVRWVWDPATVRYLRFQDGKPHRTAAGVQIGATNVVVLAVPHVPSVVDARSPEPQTVGTGTVVVHSGGVAQSGTWTRASASTGWTFTAADGSTIGLLPGTTFVELARAG